jgi:hypothetical protein
MVEAARAGGVLLMENEEGGPEPVGAATLSAWLHDEPLRLVVLNACKSATTALRSGEHPFAGIATALIREGVPAVVAMQFPISDKAAIIFSQTFYQRLAWVSQSMALAEAARSSIRAIASSRNGRRRCSIFAPGTECCSACRLLAWPASSIAATAGRDPWGEGRTPGISGQRRRSLAPLRRCWRCAPLPACTSSVRSMRHRAKHMTGSRRSRAQRRLSVHLLGAGLDRT